MASYGVPPALGVAPEMMEEISTGVCAHSSPVHAATRAISPDSFKSAPERTLTRVSPSRAPPDRPPSWRASTTEAWSWAPIPARPPGRTSRTEPRIRSRRSPTTCGCADRVRYVTYITLRVPSDLHSFGTATTHANAVTRRLTDHPLPPSRLLLGCGHAERVRVCEERRGGARHHERQR